MNGIRPWESSPARLLVSELGKEAGGQEGPQLFLSSALAWARQLPRDLFNSQCQGNFIYLTKLKSIFIYIISHKNCSNFRGRYESCFIDEELGLGSSGACPRSELVMAGPGLHLCSFPSRLSGSQALSCHQMNKGVQAIASCVCLELVKHGLGMLQERLKHWRDSTSFEVPQIV